MTNLIVDCIRNHGKVPFEDLRGPIEWAMPQHILRSAVQLEPALFAHRSELLEIAEFLETHGHRLRLWCNPEIYGQIAILTEQPEASKATKGIIQSLRVQAEMTTVSAARLPDGIHRLAHVDGSFIVVRAGVPIAINQHILDQIEGVKVFLPFNGLFADLVGESLYPTIDAAPSTDLLLPKVRRAFWLLQHLSSDLANDFGDIIHTLVLVPDLGDTMRWSYNLRLAYFGAIFINACAVDPWGIVEGMIHEYSHQRLWQWWAYDPPDGLPLPGETIRSPVTDRERSVQVMIHALVIYVAVYEFLASSNRDGLLSDREVEPVLVRCRLLSRAIPLLYTALCERIPAGTRTAAIIDFARDRFSAIRLSQRGTSF